jgi:hypothetical protein
MREVIDDIKHAMFSPVMDAVLDEVIGPDVVAMFRQQSNARAVVEPETSPFWLFGRDFQPLASPDPFQPLVIVDPARRASKQRRNLSIVLAAILTG